LASLAPRHDEREFSHGLQDLRTKTRCLIKLGFFGT
jgi:hypothetical protein